MPGAKIIIADSHVKKRQRLKEILNQGGYQVQAEVASIPDLLRKARRLLPDLVILDSELEGGSVYEIANIIEDDNLGSIIILSDYYKKSQYYEYPHIAGPISPENLLPMVEVCLLYQKKITIMRQEVERLKEDLTSRRVIEKAKGIVMEKFSLTEPEAYRRMQKISMDKSIPMKELAQAIIFKDEGI